MGMRNAMTVRRGGQGGFTLIELLIAVGVLSFGILGVATMQIAAMKGNTRAGALSSNVTWAMDRVEEIIRLPYADTNLSGAAYNSELSLTDPAQGTLHSPAQDADGMDNDRDGYTDEDGESGDQSIKWTVIDNYPINNTKTIRVTVTQAVGSAQHSVTIVYYKMGLT